MYEKEFCVKLVIYKECNKKHGQQNIEYTAMQTAGNNMLLRVWKDEIFRTHPDPPWGPTQWARGLSRG